MTQYQNITKEETFKAQIFADFFGKAKYGYEPNIDNIDFVVTDSKTRSGLFRDEPENSRHYLWAEAKKGEHDVFVMLTQLILTCKKTYQKGQYLAPPWLGCFDKTKIVFVPFHDILPIFNETDFNWNITPSCNDSADFKKAQKKVKELISTKIVIYNLKTDDKEIKEFIKTHFIEGASASIKSPITKDNFVQIFIKWVKEVKPFINIKKEEWTEFKQKGILDCDFYRADMMSDGGNVITLAEKLKIILKNDNYKFQAVFGGHLFRREIDFTDGGDAYKRFWNKYERPPAKVFQQFIIDRRDLLVPENIRERKGSFFTPKIWADKSKEYIAKVFGKDWQEEYYVWDCAAGTGNLLAGLSNEYNVWASDIEEANVETIQSLIDIDENLNLLPSHVFQFDFLNDHFDKLPEELKKIINDPEKRKKLIVYINPPYAESSGGEHAKTGVAKDHRTRDAYLHVLGKASNELFAHFMAHIYHKIPGAKLAVFSTLKYLNSSNFAKFRYFFNAQYKGGFICNANTFDNVHGQFPIGFLIWDLSVKKFPSEIKLDVLNNDGVKITKKGFYNGFRFINEWITDMFGVLSVSNMIGNLYFTSNDFQQNNLVYISLAKSKSHISHVAYNCDIFIKCSVYFAVRHCFEHTWINHNDQFLFPNDGYKTDTNFQNDCLIYTLFHGKNNIQSQHGINHWIPFTEKEVSAREKFESHFMSDFLKKKTFSRESQDVLDTGRKIWKYYHSKIKNDKAFSVNASFYDIRDYFQGRNEKGTMKTKS
ncbi:MAG: hypothetical protein LBQ50_14360, partial [Planctomycetaceae bacterium]|nr:hypothetical protein [Planctomycetaceae bacterium]